MGKVMEKIPDTLDSCSQHSLAQWFRTNFPQKCLSAIGTLVRVIDTLEHNYTHIEWLKKVQVAGATQPSDIKFNRSIGTKILLCLNGNPY